MRNTTISIVAGQAPQISRPRVTDLEFGQIIDYWTDRISRVLPDRPDLIVLPEMFDRPVVSAHPKAEQLPQEA
ncbi:MAG: hypothetical protein ACTHXG_14750, partial [Micrococcaceae bacterium]